MRSVPSVRTARKQNGKSNADSRRYTPSADQPYSRDNFFSLCDSESGGSGLPSCAVGLGLGAELLNLIERSWRAMSDRHLLSDTGRKCDAVLAAVLEDVGALFKVKKLRDAMEDARCCTACGGKPRRAVCRCDNRIAFILVGRA